jgi:hypothetical protein
MMQKRAAQTLIAVLCLLIVVLPAFAQGDGISSSTQPEFTVYACTFNPGTGRADIHGVLTGGDGARVTPDSISVSRVGASAPLPPEAATLANADPRPPLRMILVLDVTSTMPLDSVRNGLLNSLFPGLLFEDEVALISVANDTSDITTFYNDKNALYNDHLFGLTFRDSPNRIYDGVQRALEATQPNSPLRQVVLLITDSTPQEPQATPEDLITRAQASDAQIFTIGIHNLQDAPDDEGLYRLADETRGYGFTYDGEKTAAAIEAGLNDIFGRVVNTLNTEIVISTDLTGQTPDETGFIPFDVNVTLGETVLTDRAICAPPPPPDVDPSLLLPTFSVAFTNIVENLELNNPTDVQISVQPFDQVPLDAQFAFWLDDENVQSGVEGTFVFDPQALNPGRHTLRAQMRNGAGDVLATTPTTTVYTTRDLPLIVLGANAAAETTPDAGSGSGQTANLEGTVRIEAANVAPNMTEVQFRAALANTDVSYPIGTATVQDGRAILTIEDIQAEAARLFPPVEGQQGWNFQISALAPSGNAEDPPLGVSSAPLVISVAPPTETLTNSPFPPIIAAVVLMLADIGLYRAVRKRKIQRTIDIADKHDFSGPLMVLTVSRGGGSKQTHMITKKSLYIGRGSGNDVQLEDDANVSRQHGAILWRKQRWYYANRKAKVRTKVNGKEYKGLALVKLDAPADLEMGGYQVLFHASDQRSSSMMDDLVKTNL